jgi:osmotically-inducible protein OsmY
MKKTDAQIRDEVLLELDWDARLRATDVGVTVRDGVVALRGTVASFPERIAAQEDAHRVAGVLDVANDLVVRLPATDERSDADLAAWVRRALRAWPTVPEAGIRSTVSNGWVTLEGAVATEQQCRDAEVAVRALRGVRGVINRITLDETAREDPPVQVWAHDGVVTVVGTVSSPTEHRRIIDAVQRGAEGREIDDHLIVEPPPAI